MTVAQANDGQSPEVVCSGEIVTEDANLVRFQAQLTPNEEVLFSQLCWRVARRAYKRTREQVKAKRV